MDSLSRVRASGVVVEQFQDAGESECRRSWSISTRSLSIARSQNSGTAVEGEIFVKGLRAYAFHAAEASLTKIDEPSGALRVSGEMNVKDLAQDVSFNCKELTWIPESRCLSLDLGVTVSLPCKLRVTCPKVTISAAESGQTLEETIATVSDQRRRGCLTSAVVGNSAILHGPCRGWARFPVERMSLSSSEALSALGGVELAFCADGILIDMEHKALMAQGPLSISCVQHECKIGAGAGDILLDEGLVTLHDRVLSRSFGYNFKAPSITWYYGRSKRPDIADSLKRADLQKTALGMPILYDAEGNVSHFKAKVGRMQCTTQIAGKGMKFVTFWTACRSMAVGDSSVPRIMGCPKKSEMVRNFARQICNSAVSFDSSGVHVEPYRLLQGIPAIMGGRLVNSGVALQMESQVRERNVYPALAAIDDKAADCGLVTGDVVANCPIYLCKEGR